MQNSDKNFIPDGWEVKKLGDVCHFYNGKAHENSINENGKYVLVNSKFVSTDGSIKKRTNECLFPLKHGDIAIVMSDIPNGKAIAKCFYIDTNDKYTLNQRIGCLRSKKDLSEYLCKVITRNKYFLKFDDGVNQTNLKKDEILNCPLLIPPLVEQEVIAGVLGDWDNTLELLDKQIELKNQQKKHLMQTLLTGDVRLSGFTTSWEEVRLGDIGTVSSAGVDKKIIEGEESVKLLNYMDVYKKDFIYSHDIVQIVSAPDYKIENCNVKKGDIFFTPSSETPDDIAQSSVIMEDISNTVYSYHIVRLRLKTNINPIFISFALKIDGFYKQAQKVAMGSGQRYVISQDEFRNFSINIPRNIAEQNAIADVLTAADDEINFLKQKRALVAQQKKYLMQNLLTGQIRVKIGAETC